MADRVFSTLAQWTSLDDQALAKAIVDCGAAKPDPKHAKNDVTKSPSQRAAASAAEYSSLSSRPR